MGCRSKKALVGTTGKLSKFMVPWAYAFDLVCLSCGLICSSQSRILFVFDPKALNHIVTKDQKVYEEPSWFTEWVLIGFHLHIIFAPDAPRPIATIT